MSTNLIKKIEKEHQDYLKDESRNIGHADSISFPKNEKEIVDILSNLNKENTLITTQGARTGITGGSVPKGGHILNLSKLNKITGLRYDEDKKNFFLKVQPGVLLSEIKETLKKRNFNIGNWSNESLEALKILKKSPSYFFPPDPTETTASLGGMVACNASGACSFKYGPTRNYIESLKIILIDGDVIYLKRGTNKVVNGDFSIVTNSGKIIKGKIPKYNMPKVKNASGYYCMENMDLIDLFIGSEGTLGIITEMELKLIKSPEFIYGITAFFPCEDSALNFVESIRENTSPAAIEFFNHNSLNLLRKEKQTNPAFNKLLNLSPNFHTAVYIEYHGHDENSIMKMLFKAGDIIDECGGHESDTWVATNPQAREQLHFFRHAVPECVNLLIDDYRKINPNLTKLGTDMAVPDSKLKDVMEVYNTNLTKSKLDSVIFGHIGNNHLHVNIIPKDMEDYNKGKKLYNTFAEIIVKMGGTVSAEHGIGKMKKHLLKIMIGTMGLEKMKSIKTIFDPENRLNTGNLFEE